MEPEPPARGDCAGPPLRSLVLEYSCRHRLEQVARLCLEGWDTTLTEEGALPLRIACAALWSTVKWRRADHYGRVVDFVTVIWQQASDLISYRHYLKLSIAFKAKLVVDMFVKRRSLLDILQTLDRYFPRLLPADPRASWRDVQKERHCRLEFRKLVLLLIRDGNYRKRFLQDEVEDEFGSLFMAAAQRLLWEFLERLESVLLPPRLDQLLDGREDGRSFSCVERSLVSLLADPGTSVPDALLQQVQRWRRSCDPSGEFAVAPSSVQAAPAPPPVHTQACVPGWRGRHQPPPVPTSGGGGITVAGDGEPVTPDPRGRSCVPWEEGDGDTFSETDLGEESINLAASCGLPASRAAAEGRGPGVGLLASRAAAEGRVPEVGLPASRAAAEERGLPAGRAAAEGRGPVGGLPAGRAAAEGRGPGGGLPAGRAAAEGRGPGGGLPAGRAAAEGRGLQPSVFTALGFDLGSEEESGGSPWLSLSPPDPLQSQRSSRHHKHRAESPRCALGRPAARPGTEGPDRHLSPTQGPRDGLDVEVLAAAPLCREVWERLSCLPEFQPKVLLRPSCGPESRPAVVEGWGPHQDPVGGGAHRQRGRAAPRPTQPWNLHRTPRERQLHRAGQGASGEPGTQDRSLLSSSESSLPDSSDYEYSPFCSQVEPCGSWAVCCRRNELGQFISSKNKSYKRVEVRYKK